jgi:hypothetical protein
MAQAPAFSFKMAKGRTLVAVFCAGCQAGMRNSIDRVGDTIINTPVSDQLSKSFSADFLNGCLARQIGLRL